MYKDLDDIDIEVLKGEELQNELEELFDGSDYEQGVLEDAARTADKTASGLARLFVLLRNKGLITNDDIKESLKNLF